VNTGPSRVLVVEDDAGIGAMLERALTTHVCGDVRMTRTLLGAQTLAATWRPDLVLLDLGLPDGDGMTFCRDARLWLDAPIIVVSAIGDDDRKVEALDAGADDYLTKPFSLNELLARIRAVWRRAESDRGGIDVIIEIENLRIDVQRHQALVGDTVLRLSPKEFDVLTALARRFDCMVSHRELLRDVWGEGYTTEVHYVRNVIKALRCKLTEDAALIDIINERGLGYRLSPLVV
jgi:two-component system, OmpR family, KDP operon response regulator KdpE